MKLRHVVVVAFVLAFLGYLVDGGTGEESSSATERTAESVRRTSPSPTSTTSLAAEPEPTESGDEEEHAPDPAPDADPTTDSATDPGTATALLATLAVKGRAPMTGYDRARFGPAWLDADRNGCDTRNDLLREHLDDPVLESNGCVVTSGGYPDPYTGQQVDFVRGHGALLDIDHVVAMGNSWATGSFRWSVHRRAAFANDPLNLLPADASANRQKGDGDAATWLPPYKPFRCAYVARQVTVKAKYGLWVTPAEKAAIERVLGGCPDEPATPDPWRAPTEVDHRITDPGAPAPTPAPQSKALRPTPAPVPFAGAGGGGGGGSGGGPVHFQNCDAARAAGAAPVRRGDPGYGSHLDRDGDGIGCE